MYDITARSCVRLDDVMNEGLRRVLPRLPHPSEVLVQSGLGVKADVSSPDPCSTTAQNQYTRLIIANPHPPLPADDIPHPTRRAKMRRNVGESHYLVLALFFTRFIQIVRSTAGLGPR